MNNNLFYIDHSESLKQRHQNGSGLYLNAKGIVILAKTFLIHIFQTFSAGNLTTAQQVQLKMRSICLVLHILII